MLQRGRLRHGRRRRRPLAADRFHVTTTTGGAPRVLAHMEDYLQTEFPDLKVWLTSTTEQWAVIAVQGPRARDILAPLVEGIDLSAAALAAHERARRRASAACRRGCSACQLHRRTRLRDQRAGRLRPRRLGGGLGAGRPLGAVAYGTEAMHVLRAEKGYIIVGQETDGTVTPDDVGLGWAVGKTKPDFVGKRSLARPDLVAAGRKQLVGLLTETPDACWRKARRSSPMADAADRHPCDRPCHLVLLERRRSAARSRWRWSRAAAAAWARRSTCRCRTAPIAVTIARSGLLRSRRSPPRWLTRSRALGARGPLGAHRRRVDRRSRRPRPASSSAAPRGGSRSRRGLRLRRCR